MPIGAIDQLVEVHMLVRGGWHAVKYMGPAALLPALLVAIAVPGASAQVRTRMVSSKEATVYRIDVPGHTETAVTPSTVNGIVWVAVTEGTIVVGGSPKVVEQGAAKWQRGKAQIRFRATDAKSAQFVIADLTTAPQGDPPIENWASHHAIGPPDPNDPTEARSHRHESLDPGRIIEENSPQGVTLFVAVAPLHLQDQINLADEDGRWRLSEPEVVTLAAGEVRWTKAGIHVFTNVGKTSARFVMIKW